MLSYTDLLETITNNKELIFDSLDNSFIQSLYKNIKNKDKLTFIIPEEFWKRNILLSDQIRENPSILSKIINGNYAGLIKLRGTLAEALCSSNYNFVQGIKIPFTTSFPDAIFNPDLNYDSVLKILDCVLSELKKHSDDYKINITNKSILYLFLNKKYSEALFWLMLYSLFQEDIVIFNPYLPHTQYQSILSYISYNKICEKSDAFSTSQLIEIPESKFWNLRRELIRSATGKELIITGVSLADAFRQAYDEHQRSIISELEETIVKKNIQKLSIFITDPEIFDKKNNCNQPIDDISSTINTLSSRFYRLCEDYEVDLHVYFLPMLHVDHAVITDEFMAFRSTKLWTAKRDYKGAFCLYLSNHYCSIKQSEYAAHKEFLGAIAENSTVIFPSSDVDINKIGENTGKGHHQRWRQQLKDGKYKHIFFHKLYLDQLLNFSFETWTRKYTISQTFIPSTTINSQDDLYNPENLINDKTQQVLLPYIRETERIFESAIKKHDYRQNSYCRIYPSLDLGFPNNTQRLAGGFATGMLVTWNCGIKIVPIDATVNVCTSSVFELSNFDERFLKDRAYFYNYLSSIFNKASEEKGYSFSFTSGNHFLMIAREFHKPNDIYYLVLHSSAHELKNSYMGLYPVEENWYSSYVKHQYSSDNDNRYVRYLKDDAAKEFISMAHRFEHYNSQIHTWLASKINNDHPFPNQWIRHHYYMPTDDSIAIGTFAEEVGTEVPIFSAYKKPIHIFKIGSDNYQVSLSNGKKVCLVPHGWGQKIEDIEDIKIINHGKSHSEYQLLLLTKEGSYNYPVNSKVRIDNLPTKGIRCFENDTTFFKVGQKVLKGDIMHTLYPVIEYSHNAYSQQ